MDNSDDHKTNGVDFLKWQQWLHHILTVTKCIKCWLVWRLEQYYYHSLIIMHYEVPIGAVHKYNQTNKKWPSRQLLRVVGGIYFPKWQSSCGDWQKVLKTAYKPHQLTLLQLSPKFFLKCPLPHLHSKPQNLMCILRT